MFKNIGGKIKKYAVITCWLGIICCVAVGALQIYVGVTGAQLFQDSGITALLDQLTGSAKGAADSGNMTAAIVGGVLTMVIGSVMAWVGSFLTYGFGDMVENSAIRAALLLKKEMGE